MGLICMTYVVLPPVHNDNRHGLVTYNKHPAILLVRMKQKSLSAFHDLVSSRQKRILLAAGICVVALAPILMATWAYAIIEPNNKYILEESDGEKARVGIVLGAGVNKDGKPFKELQARLDVAAEALEAGRVERLILSGDNRFENYNEPDAMKDYLIETRHIPAAKLQPDYAGRSTYESCERASKVFGLKKTILFSVRSHLPRAIYLCRQFGIETYGVASHVEANNQIRREAMARVKALINVYIKGEPTVLGERIKFR